jgi:hypothetical protein
LTPIFPDGGKVGIGSGQRGQEVLGEGDERVELGRDGQVAAHSSIPLEIVNVRDFSGTQKINHARSGVSAGMGKRVGFGDEAVLDLTCERLQGQGDDEQRVLAL